MSINAALERAGLSLKKHVPGGSIAVRSAVDLSESTDALVWRWGGASSRIVTPTGATFHNFIGLWCATPKTILLFARKWGRLGVDEGGHLLLGYPQSSLGSTFQEPLEAWRYFSRRTQAVMSIAAQLQNGRPGTVEDWAALSQLAPQMTGPLLDEVQRRGSHLWILATHDLVKLASAPIDEQRIFLGGELNLWLAFSGVSFGTVPSMDQPPYWQIEISYNHQLLAFIALQLALTISGVDKLYLCSGCQKGYPRERRAPKEGWSNFCETCRGETGRSEAWRQADKKRREKIRDARRLYSEGIPLHEIVKRLNVRKIETVRNWIQKGKRHGKTQTRKR